MLPFDFGVDFGVDFVPFFFPRAMVKEAPFKLTRRADKQTNDSSP